MASAGQPAGRRLRQRAGAAPVHRRRPPERRHRGAVPPERHECRDRRHRQCTGCADLGTAVGFGGCAQKD